MQKLLTLSLLCITSTVSAQETPLKGQFDTVLNCYDPEYLFDISKEYGETALFTGIGFVPSFDGENQPSSLDGPVIFSVNQDSGTWSLIMISPTGHGCMVATGYEFEPYTE